MILLSITEETRREAYVATLEKLGLRQKQILEYLPLFKQGVTANELALYMWQRGILPIPERNRVHPRLNELIKKNLVKITGKRPCSVTGKTCAIYKYVGDSNEDQ